VQAPGCRRNDWDVVVAGAGVFGAWTAWELRRRGKRVLLVDGVGPAHARASSGGESRLTRTVYGADAVYSRMARDSLEPWRWLSGRAGLPVLHAAGVLMFFHRMEPYASASIETHRALGLPLEQLDRVELARRYPQVNWDGIEFGLLEREYGVLMARRAVQTLVADFVAQGGDYRSCDVAPPAGHGRVVALATTAGDSLRAGEFVLACGPWLPKLFPDLLGRRIFTTRQEVFFFATPRGDARFAPDHLPAWVDFDAGDMRYGCPDLESRGFKLANDRHGPAFDPDTGDRRPTEAGLADARGYLARRFPPRFRTWCWWAVGRDTGSSTDRPWAGTPRTWSPVDREPRSPGSRLRARPTRRRAACASAHRRCRLRCCGPFPGGKTLTCGKRTRPPAC
jgi:glycine/D-amino acid oxidase-like deaminating enzyme